MELGLKGKRALVMGASRGLGRGIAAALAAEGCDLILAARNAERLAQDAARHTHAHGVAATAIGLDLTDEDSVRSLIDTVKTLGGADILIANAGGPPPTGALGVAPEVWRKHFDAMVLSLIRVIDGVVPSMREKRWGRVLTIASSGVVQPIPTLAISNALRSSLVAFSKTLAGEVAADGVTANIVLPAESAPNASPKSTRPPPSAPASRRTRPRQIRRPDPDETLRHGRGIRLGLRLSGQRPRRLCHRSVIRIDGGLIQSI